MRTFTAAFTAAAKQKSALPYCVLEVDWLLNGVVTPTFYLDRPANSFANNDGKRVPTCDPNVLMMTWPSISISLKEGQVRATDSCSLTLNDANGDITSKLSQAEQQWQLVKVWRMFDDPTVQWGRDNALMLAGALRPFSWTSKDNLITLNIGDLGPLRAKSVSCPATTSIFTKTPPSYQDRNIPLCWGLANRVEAVCVQKPWETHISQNTDGSNPITVTIADDPDTMGVDGTGATTYDAWLGTDKVKVTFNQSSSPGTGTSTATISVDWNQTIATAMLLGTVDGGGGSRLIIQDAGIMPSSIGDHLADYVAAGQPMRIISYKLGTVATTLASITVNSPWWGWYTFTINDPGNAIVPYLEIGDVVKFLDTGTGARGWPTGTQLKQYGVPAVYVANMLPSKNVVRVEGFGTIADSAGGSRKDFIILGQYKQTIISGSSTTTLTGGSIIVNLNDNTWNNPQGTLLGHNVTTLTFPTGTPRDLNNNLDDDRIWVTLQGVEDVGNSTGNLITNPALILLQYLENPYLMNVVPASINLNSFANAATLLAGYYCGFAQVEAADGLSLLQHIASLCHSVLFFDQGEANMVVLTDTPQTAVWTGDTTTHDNLLQGSLSQSESSIEDVKNDLTFKWRANWDDKTGQNLLDSKDANLKSITAFGRYAQEINPVDIYWRRQDVFTELSWWLEHLTNIYRYVTFTAFLDALILQPGDWIDITWIDGAGRNLFGTVPMLVTKSTDTGKDGLVQIEARFVQFTYTP